MGNIAQNHKIKIDGVDYAVVDLSDAAKSQIENIRFSDEKIVQLKNELAISNTARAGYLRVLSKSAPHGVKSND